MRMHIRKMKRLPWILIIGLGGALATASGAWSQQKQPVSVGYSIPPGAATYTQEHLIDVGDVPGHIVRVFELHFDFKNIDLSFGGIKVKEGWVRGASDYTNGTGTASNYGITVLEDGNMLFTKEAVVAQTTPTPDGSKAVKASIVSTFVGGTGKFKGIRGQLRGNSVRDPGSKKITVDVSGEYWIEE